MPLKTPRTTAAMDTGGTTTHSPDRSEEGGAVETGGSCPACLPSLLLFGPSGSARRGRPAY